MTRVYNPFLFAHFAVFADASCTTERPREAGEAYVARLLDLVDKAALAEAAAAKWIPCLMGIDPSSLRCDAFYDGLARLGLPLVVHSGWQHSLVSESGQDWGNPLRQRRPLEAGVRVVAVHCATPGDMRDVESKGSLGCSCPTAVHAGARDDHAPPWNTVGLPRVAGRNLR